MAFPGRSTIYNLILTSGDTEYAQVLPENTFKVMIKARSTSAILKLAYVSGQSGTVFLTIPANMVYWDDNINTSGTVYLQSPTAGAVVEIMVWTGA